MSNEQDMIVWKLQNDLARARLALAQIHDVVGKVYYWDKGWAIGELECKDVERIAKTIQEYFNYDKQ